MPLGFGNAVVLQTLFSKLNSVFLTLDSDLLVKLPWCRTFPNHKCQSEPGLHNFFVD
jgi:hypothetical protein